jgi:hypothetical protein
MASPGQKTEMYSFDHDLGSFVSIGPATVSEDGTVIQSDPGVGVVKGGWHCGGNPSQTGSAAKCPDCQKCEGSLCIPDPSASSCNNGAGSCCGGECVPINTTTQLQRSVVSQEATLKCTPDTPTGTPCGPCMTCQPDACGINGQLIKKCKPAPPKTVAQCCDEINPSKTDSGGYVVCCNGQKTICLADRWRLWVAAGIYPITTGVIVQCVRKHEETHFGQSPECPTGPTQCETTGPLGPPPGNNLGPDECAASRVQVECLEAGKKQCGINSVFENCERDIQEGITASKAYGNANEPGCFTP